MLTRMWRWLAPLWIVSALAGTAWGVAELQSSKPPQQQTTGGEPSSDKTHKVSPSEEANDRIATYTLWLAIFTGALGVATIGLWVTTIFVGWNQSRDTRLLQRAYIAVAPRGVLPFDPAAPHTVAHIAVMNAGHLPARNIRWCINTKFSSNGQLDEFPIDEARLVGNNALSPGTVAERTQNDAITTEDFNALRGGGAWYFVWGAVRYTDGFGETRTTRFCHRYGKDSFRHMPQADNRLMAEAAQYHEYGNDID